MARSSAIDARWAGRARRARVLVNERPHTAAILRFYLSLLELQTAVVREVDVQPLSPAVRTPDGTVPSLDLARLPLDPLSAGFLELCRGMPPSAPAPVLEAARTAAAAAASRRADLLLALLVGDDPGRCADALAGQPAPLVFLARAFLSPVVERLAAAAAGDLAAARTPLCPRCGWPPQVSRLEDEAGAEGNRRLVCAFCATGWVFPRSVCAACGATGDDGLEFHADERLGHVRVEACRSCRSYLKTVDLRVLGLAEPLVDDLATPELDLWAERQGLEKIVPNLLGL